MKKYDLISSYINFIDSISVKPEDVNEYLQSVDSAIILGKSKISNLLTRPSVELSPLMDFVPRSTFDKFGLTQEISSDNILVAFRLSDSDYKNSLSFTEFKDYQATSTPLSAFHVAQNILRSNCQYPLEYTAEPCVMAKSIREYYKNEIMQDVEISIKYSGYIEREERIAQKLSRLNNLKIPEGFDFTKVESLSIECRQKLMRYKPKTIAEASRISGVSPSDISVLLVYFGR